MSWTNEYIGLPYKLYGRTKRGIDCWGLVRLVYSDRFGVELPSYSQNYSHTMDHEGFVKSFGEEIRRWTPVDEPEEFDVAWCRVAGIECHTGIMLGNGRMLHAMLGNDSCIVRVDNPAWQRRVLQCYRLM